MLTPLIAQLLEKKDLSFEESKAATTHFLAGEFSAEDAKTFLTLLAAKGESPAELAGAATALREHMHTISAPEGTIDVCGTGGDGAHLFNISTAVSFVVAGAGVPVAKHGNKGVTSTSGSSQVLTALGVHIDMPPETAEKALFEAGITFLFAPNFHAALRHIAPIRAALGTRTIFNALGPLVNPARVQHQLIGTWDAHIAERMASAVSLLGTTHTLLVSSGITDEALPSQPLTIYDVTPDHLLKTDTMNTQFPPADLSLLTVSTPEESALLIKQLLADSGPAAAKHIVILNAAYALLAANAVTTVEEGIALAKASLVGGHAYGALCELIRISTPK